MKTRYELTTTRKEKLQISARIKAKSLGFDTVDEFKEMDYRQYMNHMRYVTRFSTKVIDQMNKKAAKRFRVRCGLPGSEMKKVRGIALKSGPTAVPVTVNGIEYPSLKKAKKETGLTRKEIKELNNL